MTTSIHDAEARANHYEYKYRLEQEGEAYLTRKRIFDHFGVYVFPQDIHYVSTRTSQDGMVTTWRVTLDGHTILMEITLDGQIVRHITLLVDEDDDDYVFDAGPSDLADLLKRMSVPQTPLA